MISKINIWIGNWLFNNCYSIYRNAYFFYKRQSDSNEIKLIRRNIKKDDVVMDIGANIGFYTSFFSKLVGANGQIYAFEPHSSNYIKLSDSNIPLKNVKTFKLAVGPSSGNITLYESKMLNVDHRTYDTGYPSKKVEVEMVSLDDFCKLNSVSKIDFIKMDIQGYEMNAIQGMRETLINNKSLKILSEFWPFGLKKAGYSAVEYYSSLKSCGFMVFLLMEDNMFLLHEDYVNQMNNLPETDFFNIFCKKEC